MSGDLRNKTAKGISWGFIDNIMNTGIIALVNIILARLLSDTDFGIIGLTAVFITLAIAMVDSGFTGALVRKIDVSERDFNTVFYFNLIVSTLLYVILFFTAPFISSFFDIEILTPIIRILGFSLIITALSIVQKAILVINIDFKTQAIISAISSVSAGVVAIIMALRGC